MSDILPSDDEITAARTGIYIQLHTTLIADHFGSLTGGIKLLGLDDFIENQVMTNASRVAWVRYTENRLNKDK